MTRAHVEVRDATPDDLPDLLAMWTELRSLAPRSERAFPDPSPEGVLARLAQAQADPSVRVVVATLPGDGGPEVAGFAVLTAQPYAALFDAGAAHLHYLHVRPERRRRGVGRALVATAASFAEERGAEHVLTSVSPSLREANRFYARLGFGPVVVRRAVSVTALRRRLAGDARTPGLEEVLQRRRSLRVRRAAVLAD